MQRRKFDFIKRLFRWYTFVGVLFGVVHALVVSLYSLKTAEKTMSVGINYDQSVIKSFVSQQSENSTNNPESGFIAIGVMTAAHYLLTRAVAVNNTWANGVPGSVFFFSSPEQHGQGKESLDLHLVHLDGVDDSYPPQRKSFLMLKYLHDNYIENFQWFMRADDDVYIRGELLGNFLSKLDSNKPYYIGQSGEGRDWEREELDLSSDWKYCMGGPGVVLSRGLLRQLVRHIPTCMQELFTNHEDTELGRCIYRRLGVSCTPPSKKMKMLFHHFYRSNNGSFFDDLNHGEVNNAITLHPVKDPRYMYRLHCYFQSQEYLEILTRQYQIEKDNKETIKDNLNKKSNPKLTWYPFNDKFRYVNADHVIRRRLTVSEISNLQTLTGAIQKYYSSKEIKVVNGYLAVNNMEDIIYDIKAKHKSYLSRVLVKRQFGQLQVKISKTPTETTISIILPLSGKTKELRRFLNSFKTTHFKFYQIFPSFRLQLTIIGFPDGLNYTENNQIVKNFKDTNPDITIIFRNLKGSFSRGRALNFGAEAIYSEMKERRLLIFMDVDILFTEIFLVDAIYHTVRGHQVYFPIVFSEFNRRVVCKVAPNLCNVGGSAGRDFKNDPRNGYWRIFGYGIVSIYRSDFIKCGQFDALLEGWGREDIDLVEKVLASASLRVFRAVQPDLIHIYHDQGCSGELSVQQKKMCIGSFLSNLGSKYLLTTLLKQKNLLKSNLKY